MNIWLTGIIIVIFSVLFYSIFQTPMTLGYLPSSREECVPDRVCFVQGDYLTYAGFVNDQPSGIENYTYGGLMNTGEIWVNIDFIPVEGGGYVTNPHGGIPMDPRIGINNGQYEIIQPSPVKIEKWTKDSPSAETWKDRVAEGSYNYNGFMRKVIVLNIESPTDIIDKETGILLFHHDYFFYDNNNSTDNLVSTNIIQSSNFPDSDSSLPSRNAAQIPEWIKKNALWWSEGKIGDTDFVLGIKYLIEQNIMKIPSTEGGSSNSQQIPSWIKNNAKWWADGQISDDDFVKGIQYLISNGIMKISTIENTSLCQGTKLCITGTVEKIVDGDTIYVKGEKIRLSLTNTPEKNEAGYAEATQFTSTLCPIGSTVTVDQDDKQPYDVFGRTVGKVFCGSKMLNEELLLNNHAKILTQYCAKSEYANELWAKKFGCY